MLTTAVIAFREFLEAFLLIGIFIGIDRKLELHKRKEILCATALGLSISLLLPVAVFLLANNVKNVLIEKNTDLLEGYFLIFSGFFLAYVIFSLHVFMKQFRDKTIADAHEKMRAEIFDLSLFFTIVFFIAREGFEVALLVAGTSMFSVFWTNITGLILGFLGASVVGLSTVVTYIKLPIGKVFVYTEYFILLIGAAMVKNGVTILSESYMHLHLERYISLPLQFLPNDETILGHLLKNLTGLQRDFSIVQLALMIGYVGIIYLLFMTKKV